MPKTDFWIQSDQTAGEKLLERDGQRVSWVLKDMGQKEKAAERAGYSSEAEGRKSHDLLTLAQSAGYVMESNKFP